MEKDYKEKLKILHIGADPEFLSPIVYQNILVEIETIDNPFSVSQWILQNGLPDAVICEKTLPGGSGGRFYDFWVTQFDADRRIPFILLEDGKNQGPVSPGREEKLEDVFIKPTHAEILIDRILMLRKDKPSPQSASISEMNGFKPFKFTLLKRIFDLITASIFLIIVSPILLIAVIAIRLESKGNVFYISKKVGAGFKVFDFYKLRSMYAHSDQRLKELAHLNENIKETSLPRAEKAKTTIHSINHAVNGKSATAKGDSRITKVGYVLRKLNLDELPQMFNVIKGDISMVGNRPLPIYEAELLTPNDWTDRFNSPAGVTGIWKVVSRRKLRSMSHEVRNSLQNKYSLVTRHPNSFWNDLWIIMQTIPVMFNKKKL